MNAERRKPSTLSGIAPEATPYRGSVVPPGPSSEPDLSELELVTPLPPPRARETGLSWKTLLGTDEPPTDRRASDAAGPRRSYSEMRPVSSRSVSSHPPQASAGFYSTRPPAEELIEVLIPSKRASELEPSSLGRGASMPSPRIFFSERIREQADDWLRSGSLSLPNCSSPRHARAAQRALLLALLDEPGYNALPLGFKQRIGWLFNQGWERTAGSASFDELSDLMTMLGVPAQGEARESLLLAVQALVPDPLPLGRPPSSYPPARR